MGSRATLVSASLPEKGQSSGSRQQAGRGEKRDAEVLVTCPRALHTGTQAPQSRQVTLPTSLLL